MKPDVAIEYQKMREIASTFEAEAERVKQVMKSVDKHLETLKKGGWIADAATHFYGEMDSDVRPSLDRLQKALTAASDTSHEIIRLMKQAEEDASAQLPIE